MTLWLVLGAIALAATAAVVLPLLRRQPLPPSRAAHDLEIYRDQLAEVGRDQARGLITDDQAEAARTEIARRMLAVDEAAEAAEAPPGPRDGIGGGARRALAAGLAVVVPLAAAGLYALNGAPSLQTRRAADVVAAGDGGAAAPGEDMSSLVARLAERLEEQPDDARGWTLLARTLVTLGRYGEAAEAYDRLVRLRPEDAALRALHGEALVAANGGIVTSAARDAFGAALAREAGEPRARFYLGLSDLQAGKREAALARWRALEASSPPDAAWLPMLRERIAEAAGAEAPAGADAAPAPGPAAAAPALPRLPAASDPASAAPPGPSREDMAAAARMAPEDRMAMIRSMVARLAERLEAAPDDVEGWRRLARSYRVLGEKAKARDALAEVVRLSPEDVDALGAYAESMLETAGDGPPPATFGKVIGDILRLDPENRRALWIAGLMAAESGAKDEARRFWSRLQPLLPAGSAERAELDRRIETLGKGP